MGVVQKTLCLIVIIGTIAEVLSAEIKDKALAPIGSQRPGRKIVFRSTGGDGQAYPCPQAGFYPNPANCTQFYRCVDYLGTGQVFSVYMFECPKYHVFIPIKETCVPGRCPTSSEFGTPGLIQQDPPFPGVDQVGFPIVQASTIRPVTEQRPMTTTPSVPKFPQTVSYPNPPSGPVSTTAPSVTTTGRPTLPTTAFPTVTGSSECLEGMYQQHMKYCNVYQTCNSKKVNYACDFGSAFDFDRQMCRIDSDGSLCSGKKILSLDHLFRNVAPVPVQPQPPSGIYHRLNQMHLQNLLQQQKPNEPIPSGLLKQEPATHSNPLTSGLTSTLPVQYQQIPLGHHPYYFQVSNPQSSHYDPYRYEFSNPQQQQTYANFNSGLNNPQQQQTYANFNSGLNNPQQQQTYANFYSGLNNPQLQQAYANFNSGLKNQQQHQTYAHFKSALDNQQQQHNPNYIKPQRVTIFK